MKTVKMSMVTIMAVLAMVVFPQGDMQATPQQAGTNAQVDRDVTIQNSRVVTVQRFYSSNQSIPNTIRYNQGGYSGTLQRVSTNSEFGGHTVTYRGTVYCSGTCPI